MSAKRTLLTIVAGLVGVSISASAAQADDTFAALVCAFDSTTVQIKPPPPADEFTGGAWDPLELMDIEPDSMDFETTAFCAGADAASEWFSPGPQLLAPTSVAAVVTGVYDDLAVGTGTASGVLTLSASDLHVVARFAIESVFGQGVMSIVVQDGWITIGGNTNEIDGGGGDGVWLITGAPDPGCFASSHCYTISGGFETSLSGEGSTTFGASDSDT